MKKQFLLLLLFTVLFGGCKKKEQSTGCDTKSCTGSFESILIRFVDKNGSPVTPAYFYAVKKSTNESVIPPTAGAPADGYHVVTDDTMAGKFSDVGDDVQVTGILSTGQTKTTLYRISGGACKCHVEKIYGPSVLAFE